MQIVDIPQKVLFKYLHMQRRSFLLQNLQFDTKLPLSNYEVKNIFSKRLCAWRNFKIILSILLFIIIFRAKISISGPYTILTGHIKVESVAYQVLSEIVLCQAQYLLWHALLTKRKKDKEILLMNRCFMNHKLLSTSDYDHDPHTL